jgi:hypothetical protein
LKRASTVKPKVAKTTSAMLKFPNMIRMIRRKKKKGEWKESESKEWKMKLETKRKVEHLVLKIPLSGEELVERGKRKEKGKGWWITTWQVVAFFIDFSFTGIVSDYTIVDRR